LRFAAELKARINSSVGEAIRLARTDKALSARIALEQAALEARLLAAQRAAALAKLAEEAASAARAVRARAAAQQQANRAAAAAAARENTFRSNGSEARALPPVHQSAVPVSTSAGISLATVGGITVAAQIAGPLQALLSAARAGGLTLTGGGYRSSAQQITLRAAHCGASYYAIYQMPAGSCHPPTAPPGQSMHEVGLAIDFSNCSSHGTACYRWLSANASRFGFYNLPSEPWHWSINGH
jgi:LAS superfamily LD-carboxypeptidase LdcB